MSSDIGRLVLIVIIGAIILAGCAFLFVRHYWLQFQRVGRRFNYRITDIWAAMLGIAPSIVAATVFLSSTESPNFRWEQARGPLLSIVALAVFQIAGLAVGRIDIELPPHFGARNGFESGVSIVTGALIGLLVYCGSFTVMVIVLAILGLL